MYLENLVIDAADPQRLGRFWEGVLGSERLTDEPDAFETRLAVQGGPVLDVCFQRVGPGRGADPRGAAAAPPGPRGRAPRAEEVERLLGLGARSLDIGQGGVPWVVLADPEGNPCCVMEERGGVRRHRTARGAPLDSADPRPGRASSGPGSPAGRTPALRPGPCATRRCAGRSSSCALSRHRRGTAKNRLHLDVRLETGEDPDGSRPASPSAAAASSTRRGASCRGGTTPTRRATSSACCRRTAD